MVPKTAIILNSRSVSLTNIFQPYAIFKEAENGGTPMKRRIFPAKPRPGASAFCVAFSVFHTYIRIAEIFNFLYAEDRNRERKLSQ